MYRKIFRYLTVAALVLLAGCATTAGLKPVVDSGSSTPGTSVAIKGEKVTLSGTPLTVGGTLPEVLLVDAFSMKKIDLSRLKGDVLFLSMVPSLDTRVCEAQTHVLGEEGGRMPAGIIRITISRDTPFAQKRFAQEAGLTGITYLSDYREGAFGRATGLLQEESRLLARAVILVDRKGIVRYIQVVPELTHLPDMKAAFARAEALLAEP